MNYYVTYPVAGQVTVCVSADSEEEAIEAGYDLVTHPEAMMEWDAMEHIIEGNVFCGSINSIDVEETDDEAFSR